MLRLMDLLLLLPLWLLLLHSQGTVASSFVLFIPHHDLRLQSSSSSSSLTVIFESLKEGVPLQQQQQQQQQQPSPLQPVIIVDGDIGGATAAAKAATLALQTWQVLKGHVQLPSNHHPHSHGSKSSSSSTTPNQQPDQPPVFLVSSMAELRQVNQPVILHLPMDIRNAAASILSSQETLKHPPLFIGLHLYSNNNDDLDDDSFDQSAGTALQEILRSLPIRSHGDGEETAAASASPSISACVSLDLELHLALLRINALPKDINPAHGDSYHVLMPEGGSLLIDYQYDHDNPFGGTDPLKCPTKQVLIDTPPTAPSLQRSRHLAAAYTAVCGQKEASSTTLSAAIIAASVATILGDDDNGRSSTTTTWNMIQRTVQLCSHIRNFGIKEQVSGFMRQKYKEYGYK